MKRFWIVVRAPVTTIDRHISKQPGNIYWTRKEADDRAKQIAGEGHNMLVLEVVGGFGPTEPPVRKLSITK